jgi:hypothetical protein
MSDPFVEMDKSISGHRDSPLNPVHVEEVFNACLARGEVDHPTITAVGILHKANFAMKRLDERKAEIGGMLAQLPVEFLPHDVGGGNGWSFLQACMDKDGRQWTGLHLTMEQLVLLGLATGQVVFCMPREMWDILPEKMPYFMVVLEHEVVYHCHFCGEKLVLDESGMSYTTEVGEFWSDVLNDSVLAHPDCLPRGIDAVITGTDPEWRLA